MVPDDPRSIEKFVLKSKAELLHHVIFFTAQSYAEVQKQARHLIARRAGADMAGENRKKIIGDEARIKEEMTKLSLDR